MKGKERMCANRVCLLGSRKPYKDIGKIEWRQAIYIGTCPRCGTPFYENQWVHWGKITDEEYLPKTVVCVDRQCVEIQLYGEPKPKYKMRNIADMFG